MTIAKSPDYNLIIKYINEAVVNEVYFLRNLKYLFNKPEYKKIEQYFIGEKLDKDDNLYFFAVYFYDSYQFYKWGTDVELYKIWKNYNSDLEELKNFFINIENDSVSADSKDMDFLISLRLKSKKRDVTINASPLLFDIFDQMLDWVKEKEFRTLPKEKNKKAYLQLFIAGTKPLFLYLKNTHFKNETDQAVYSFIADFVLAIGYDWTGRDGLAREEYIRKSYK